MRILVAGATGAIGKRLVPGLVAACHHVVATSRSRDKLNCLRSEGAEAVLMDGLDADGVLRVVTAARPDVIVHQMTALAPMLNTKRFDDELALTNRLRTEGASHLVSAAIGAGVRRLVAQSYTGWPNQRQGVVDDEPAEVSEWLSDLARVLTAKAPYRVPAWIGRLAIGEVGVSLMTAIRGASNVKAKREFGWRLEYPSWRDGFRRGLAVKALSAMDRSRPLSPVTR